MRTARTLLTVVAIAVAVPGAASAQLPDVPDLPDVPELPQVPELPVPEVPDPPPLPELPDLPVPTPAPDVPDLPAVPAPGAGGASPAPSDGGGGGGGGSPPASSSSGGGTPSSSAPPAAGGPQASRAAPRGTAIPRERRRSERRLRRAVARLDGCLDELPSTQRRVLVLRAGIGRAEPRSRRSVARALELRVDRVRRLERRGLRTARRLARTDACGSPAGGATPVIAGPSTPARSGPTQSADGPSGGGGLGGGTPKDGTTGSAPESGDIRGESVTRPPSGFGGRGDATGTSIWIALALMLLAALAGYATPTVRDRLRGAGRASRAS